MKTLVIVRHAQSLLNTGDTDHHDPDLSKKGYEQLLSLPLNLKSHLGTDWHKKPWTGFVSPFLRTLHTAGPLQKLGINFHVDHRIAEAPDESYKKLRLDDLISRHEQFPDYNWGRFPKTGILQAERVMAAYELGLDDFLKTRPDFAIVVTHMSPVFHLTERVSGGKVSGQVGNTSVTLLEGNKLVFFGKS